MMGVIRNMSLASAVKQTARDIAEVVGGGKTLSGRRVRRAAEGHP